MTREQVNSELAANQAEAALQTGVRNYDGSEAKRYEAYHPGIEVVHDAEGKQLLKSRFFFFMASPPVTGGDLVSVQHLRALRAAGVDARILYLPNKILGKSIADFPSDVPLNFLGGDIILTSGDFVVVGESQGPVYRDSAHWLHGQLDVPNFIMFNQAVHWMPYAFSCPEQINNYRMAGLICASQFVYEYMSKGLMMKPEEIFYTVDLVCPATEIPEFILRAPSSLERSDLRATTQWLHNYIATNETLQLAGFNLSTEQALAQGQVRSMLNAEQVADYQEQAQSSHHRLETLGHYPLRRWSNANSTSAGASSVSATANASAIAVAGNSVSVGASAGAIAVAATAQGTTLSYAEFTQAQADYAHMVQRLEQVKAAEWQVDLGASSTRKGRSTKATAKTATKSASKTTKASTKSKSTAATAPATPVALATRQDELGVVPAGMTGGEYLAALEAASVPSHTAQLESLITGVNSLQFSEGENQKFHNLATAQSKPLCTISYIVNFRKRYVETNFLIFAFLSAYPEYADKVRIVPIERAHHDVVLETMRASDIFVVSGYMDSHNLPAVEAMACGCHVVGYTGLSYDVAYFNEGNGWWFKNEGQIKQHVELLKNAVDLYYANDDQSLHKRRTIIENAQRTVARLFSKDSETTQIVPAYQAIWERRIREIGQRDDLVFSWDTPGQMYDVS